jgi:hypothetical protein
MKRLAIALGTLLVACGAKPAPPADSPPSPPPATPDVAAAPDASAPTPTATDAPDAATPTPAPAASTDSATPTPDDSPSGDAAGVAYMESVTLLYKQHRDALTKACWLHAKSSEHAYAGKSVIRVGPGGKVISVKTDGTDDPTSACIDKQMKKWKFPPPTGTAMVTLPVRLHRD